MTGKWRATKAYLKSWLPSFSSSASPNPPSPSNTSPPPMAMQQYADTFECAACGASGPTTIFEDLVSGDSVCMCCGTVQSQDRRMLDCAEIAPAATTYANAVFANHGATTATADTDPTTAHLLPNEVMADVEREIHAARNPTMCPAVTTDETTEPGCSYRMFDKPFDIIAKRCDLMDGLQNRRATVAMRSACERVAIMHPEFALTHDPGVQAVAAYVVATHPPGVDRGRTRLLKEGDEECGLRGTCVELDVTLSAVAKCVRNHGDRLYAAMKTARRLGILPELDPGGHLTAAETKRRLMTTSGGRSSSLTKTRAARRTKKSRK